MDKVLVVIIAKDHVMPECWGSVLQQRYEDFDVLLHVRKPRCQHPDPVKKKYLNCADNREAARRLALGSQAQRFLFVDSDIILPGDAIAELVKQPFAVQGGWYRIQESDRYACGRWVGDNLFVNLYRVEP